MSVKRITGIQVLVLMFTILASTAHAAPAKDGAVSITKEDVSPGARLDISGEWLFKPGYALSAGEKPADPSSPESGYFKVPVPQMLSRIRWWLDDSEGFKAFEEKRLKALGFDTDRAEDGWYKLWIHVPEGLGSRHIFVRFDGVAMKSSVYLNGSKLGDHAGMFSRFGFDLAPRLKPGKNLLAVYVSMEKLDPDVVTLGEAVTVNLTMSKVVSMDKAMFGPLSPVNDNRAYDLHGIWQPVTLESCGGAKIENAWFIPKLDSAEVKTELSSLGSSMDASIGVKWTDARTGLLLHAIPETSVKLDQSKKSVSLKASGIKPNLWTPEHPYLYLMEVTLRAKDGKVLDRYKQKVGFRTFEVRGNSLYLNGRRYWLRGANQLPYGKNPWDKRLAEKLIRYAHEGNAMITRTHCTPWNEAWLDTADEIGLGVSIEGMRPWAFVGKIPPPPAEMMEHWKMENEDVIRRCRNHPSVLIWTVGNEMTLRDDENVKKWEMLSDMVKQTRSLDPTRPVVCSSTYHRDRKFFEEKMKPKGIDDGDMEDLHSYRGWYAGSAFVQDSSWIDKLCDYKGERPIVGQEIATGYPNLDDGLPVTNYSVKLMVPQAWVGDDGQPGGDPSAFLEHLRAVTKRTAEQLRYERGENTSGFLLFSSECWYKNSFDPATLKPYPVWEGVKYAFAPVGLALQTPNRRFFGGDEFKTAVFVTDDEKDIKGPFTVSLEMVTPDGRSSTVGSANWPEGIKYYQTVRVPVAISVPEIKDRSKMLLRTRLIKDGREISRTEDPVEIFSHAWAESPLAGLPRGAVSYKGIGPELAAFLKKAPQGSVAEGAVDSGSRVLLVGGGPSAEEMSSLKAFAEGGGVVILLGCGTDGQNLFPGEITKSRETPGEFVDLSVGPKELFAGFEKFDFKWWGRGDDKAYVISATHNLVSDGGAKALMRHIVVHGYIDEAKKQDYVTSPLVEIPQGKGRFILCELNLEQSVGWDAITGRFIGQLLDWAQKR